MKKVIALLLALTLMLAGCGNSTAPAATEAPATEAAPEVPAVTEAPVEETTEPTTVPTTEPIVYTNPLNGEVIDAPYTGRVYASTISNIKPALPHVGVNQADILMEMYVNNSIVRCLALYSDISDVPSIGSVRSMRLMFADLADHYDLIVSHAYGSETVMKNVKERGLEDINLGNGGTDYSFRDAQRKSKLGLEHSLMGIGSGIVERAQELGYRTEQPEGKDYGFRFTENGIPANGEEAPQIRIMLTYDSATKETIMTYDADLSKYVFNQYGKEMVDDADGQKEAFTNVLVVYADISTVKGSGALYHTADFLAGGTGYYANGGKIVPITWTCDDEKEPLHFFNEDGSELLMGVGNTYMAICSADSAVEY